MLWPRATSENEVSMPASFLHGVEVIEIDAGPRPIQTVKSSVIGIVGTAPDADATAFPLNTPVLIAGSRKEAAGLDTVGDSAGTLPAALDGIFDHIGAVVIVVRVEEGADETATLANVVGGVNAIDGNLEGVHALVGAESVVGYAPRILIAPGFTHQRPGDLANPVVSELQGIADRLRAVIIADGPNTTDDAAYTAAGDFGSDRIYLVDPWHKVMVGDAVVDLPPSSRVAGIIAKVDNDTGFWASPSNHLVYGILGTSRPVDFKLGDPNSRANLLNEQKVATTIRQNGFRLWGNRSLTADTKWVFLSVRRTADIINDSLLRAHLWAVDRGITKTYVEDVTEGVNAYLRDLVAMGAILGGKCWADPDLNSAANIQLGKVFFNFDFTPVYPAEHITFQSHLVNDYIEEVFN
jgi:Phage tail sheath protein FI